jgi:hypothetical protein
MTLEGNRRYARLVPGELLVCRDCGSVIPYGDYQDVHDRHHRKLE